MKKTGINKGHILFYGLILLILGNILLYHSKHQTTIPKPLLGMDYKTQEKLYLISAIAGGIIVLSVSLINIKAIKED